MTNPKFRLCIFLFIYNTLVIEYNVPSILCLIPFIVYLKLNDIKNGCQHFVKETSSMAFSRNEISF